MAAFAPRLLTEPPAERLTATPRVPMVVPAAPAIVYTCVPTMVPRLTTVPAPPLTATARVWPEISACVTVAEPLTRRPPDRRDTAAPGLEG